jgi:type III secretory pathway component EscR
MDANLSLRNATKLRQTMDMYRPLTVSTPFDILCNVALEFSKMLLDQHIEELRRHERQPRDAGS